MSEAIRFALVQSAQRIYLSALKSGDRPGYSKLIRRYLTREHRDNPQHGCVLASLGVEVARDGGDARAVFSEGFEELIALLAKLSPERSPRARRAHVLSVISALTGALSLARAVEGERMSQDILSSVRTTLLAEEKRRQTESARRRNARQTGRRG